MTSVNENIKRLEELSQEDGTGVLLVCYETGREKPHADSSYQLYPVNPDQKGMTYQFLSLLHVGVETARISAFIPFIGIPPSKSISPACCCPISKRTG